jgi:RNA polymerase sigma factor (sigma-70 family)
VATTAGAAATISRRSDEHLGRRLALGEAPAFDELYRRYVHRLAAYGAHLLGDGAAGDDVAQVALMRAYQALRSGHVPESVRPWLFRIAHNAAVDAVRNRRELPSAALPERAVGSESGTGALIEAIAALPERQRNVFVLRELHGLRIAETAAELGLTAQQVEQSLFAARNRLAEQLVFGERLGCEAVRRLAAGPLDLRERRALKTHVRSCPACRRELGRRGVALALIPWFRLPHRASPAKLGVAVGAAVLAAVPLGATLPEGHHTAAHPAPLRREVGPDVPLTLLVQRPAAVVTHRRVRHVERAHTRPAPVQPAPAPLPVPAPTVSSAPPAATAAPAVVSHPARAVPVSRHEHHPTRLVPRDAPDGGPPAAVTTVVAATTTVEDGGGSGDSGDMNTATTSGGDSGGGGGPGPD